MTDDSQNLIKMMVSQLYLLNQQMAAKDMFGRGYFSLALPEKAAVDNTVWGTALAVSQSLTPEILTGTAATQQPVGFVQPGKS